MVDSAKVLKMFLLSLMKTEKSPPPKVNVRQSQLPHPDSQRQPSPASPVSQGPLALNSSVSLTWMVSTSWTSSWISFTRRWYFCCGVSFTPQPSPSCGPQRDVIKATLEQVVYFKPWKPLELASCSGVIFSSKVRGGTPGQEELTISNSPDS